MHLQLKRRLYIACILLTGIFTLLMIRLAWVQIVQVNRTMPGFQRTVREMSVLQRERGVVLDTGRGQFTDYKGQPLTGKLEWGLVFFPHTNQSSHSYPSTRADSEVKKMAALLHTNVKLLQEEWNQGDTPHFWTAGARQPVTLTDSQVARLRELQVDGASIYPMMTRYGQGDTGMQWLGYLAERPGSLNTQAGHKDEVKQPFAMKSGAAGLERTLEPLLKGIGPTLVSRMVTGSGEVIATIQPRVIAPSNTHYPLRAQTTIDAKIQQGIEHIVQNSDMKEGAIVVLDAANADVRAMVSLPFYNPQHVDPNQTAWANRAVKGAVPGSIFKIVTAAAALEYQAVSKGETFHCGGEWGKYGLSCWKEHGHGELNLEQGFAESCNIVFAETARRLSMEQLERMADALGLGRPVGWEGKQVAGMSVLQHFDHEEAGRVRLPSVSPQNEGAKVQTAIGQRDVLVTPLQAANLIVTLLHEGKVSAPRLVQRIRYADGDTMLEIPQHDSPSAAGQISPATAHQLLSWMRKVVSEGTGKSLQHARWQVAGKSGTAQVQQRGEKRNHQWFIGYGPTHQPKYAVAVLVQNVAPNSRHQATEMFRKVMDYLAESS
ncbi:peptidoglycan D,D-transpeptidase FtsI family protein [Paenibacillus pabuli]|uniref:peptidoglycan D,D-transpeptidase FtsI family protein n=1 Tax=Paenibacillus pabuli TaxID=1472 RepID=UPI0007819D28|nr:penicillin-binding transpeptidase domain-containing protein [Paenibacillus pabuli]MEC0124756.1 penicillin-binding transpeptidase domain-containing protein [Paenibacillus pabuli]